MTAPRLPINLAYTPQMIDCSGQFVVPSNATTPNAQIIPALLTVGTQGTSQLTPTSTQSPLGCLFPVFCTPNATAPQPSTNVNRLPPGVVTTQQTAGTEFMIDCSGFPCDIISAQVGLTGGRGSQTLDAVISAIDNVNKLVYVQIVSWGNGNAATAPAGTMLAYQIVMKDTYAV